jgi:hypothetical protein
MAVLQSVQRPVRVEVEQHAAADLVIGWVHRHVLRHGVDVAEAAFERVAGVDRGAAGVGVR